MVVPRHSASLISYSFRRATAALLLGAYFLPTLLTAKTTVYEKIDEKFAQYRDAGGYLWQVSKSGSLTSGDTQYLPSGLRLVIDDKPFAPTYAVLTDLSDEGGAIDLALSQTTQNGLLIKRSTWLDLERNGMRVLDQITNKSAAPLAIDLALRTAFQYPWQGLVDDHGSLLDNGRAKLPIDPSATAIGTKFGLSEGREDTLILYGSEHLGQRPDITASTNGRELVLSYRLEIPAGETRSVLHWVLRRNLPQLDDLPIITSPFLSNNQLISPRLSDAEIATVANFGERSFSKSDDIANAPNTQPIPANTQAIIELRSGEVLTVADLHPTLAATTVWGDIALPLGSIKSVIHLSEPRPQARLQLTDGSSISVFLKPTPIELKLTDGSSQSLDPLSILSISRPKNERIMTEWFQSEWKTLADVPTELLTKQPTCLMTGNQLLANGANFAITADSITLLISKTARPIALRQRLDFSATGSPQKGDGP